MSNSGFIPQSPVEAAIGPLPPDSAAYVPVTTVDDPPLDPAAQAARIRHEEAASIAANDDDERTTRRVPYSAAPCTVIGKSGSPRVPHRFIYWLMLRRVARRSSPLWLGITATRGVWRPCR